MQAIQAHSWPHSQLKGQSISCVTSKTTSIRTLTEGPNYKPSPKFKELIDTDVFNSITQVKEVRLNEDRNEPNVDIEDIDNFEDLFIRFSQLKGIDAKVLIK